MDLKRVKKIRSGSIILIIFCALTIVAVPATLCGFVSALKSFGIILWVMLSLAETIFLSVLFWIGIVTVYLYSAQLAIKTRVLGIVFGPIPVANVIMLLIIIRKTLREAITEKNKIELNESRKEQKICATKYPILLVHGVFFRDFDHLNYWGRIPSQLEINGARIFYGNHNSAASSQDSAIELAKRIEGIVNETGCEKVNVIAHSKGGLDIRTAIADDELSTRRYVASLTTINTPHRGCEFADYLLGKIPRKQQEAVAKMYNGAAKRLGDVNPDFMAAVSDLTHEKCEERNKTVLDNPEIYYQSVGSKMERAGYGRFPLNFSHGLVKFFDGPNDGLVGEKSFKWGENYQFLTTTGKRGISHADMIDLNRENFAGFDVREFYVQLVADLKSKGF